MVYMFSLRFSVSKFLVKLRRQFRIRKIFFVYVKFFVHKFWRELQSFHFEFKMLNLYSRLLFHRNLFINKLLKELQNCILGTSPCVVIILFNTGLYRAGFSACSFGKLVFLSFCAFCDYCLFWIWCTLHKLL